MQKKAIQNLTIGALTAALYVVFTFISSLFGLSSGVIQVRFSEALCILPIFFPASIPGLVIGCFLSNLLTGAVIFDVLFGTVATLIGAIGTYLLRKTKVLGFLSPVVANALIVPWVLKCAYGFTEAVPYLMLTVGLGELVSVCALGAILHSFIKKHPHLFDKIH